jgi:hypothetical protein
MPKYQKPEIVWLKQKPVSLSIGAFRGDSLADLPARH